MVGTVRLLKYLLIAFAVVMLSVRPALAQSILRDAETETFLADISRDLIVAAGLDPANVKVVLIGDPSINAFVAGGQIVYIHSGLIEAADDANQVQGVIAHELGHIAGGHIVRFGEGAQVATGITLVSLLLGAAAMAAGAGEAGMAILSGGQQAAMGKFLAFTRTQESSADQAGARYLAKAGLSGRGSLDFFRKLQNQEYRLAIPQNDGYGRTHPLTGDRMAALEQTYKAAPNWEKPGDPAIEKRFARIKAKLLGFTQDPTRTLQVYPESDQSVPAHYARAYAWHRGAYPDKAQQEVAALVAADPGDPYFLELQGQILLESGRPTDAITPLRAAVRRSGGQPMIAVMLGHALIATEDKQYFGEAKQILRSAVNRDNDNPFAWYQLGIIYDREGDRPRAALATAERFNLIGNARGALTNARVAMNGLSAGTPDWIRAQDIAMVSEHEVAGERRRR
jgi:predicted Zn-dependent protease